ncbi:MAG TPA: diguanylate cyclase, partial [Thermoclostridium sp.]|nr:diguanylate cyclase [Thermoclostridium sp.]
MFVIFILILGIITAVPGSALRIDEPRHVLILNSYHEGFTWTREIVEGILNSLEKSDYMTKYILDISVEYMDWKNYPSQENLDRLYEHFLFKYKDRRIDIIITSDDAAL